MSKSAVTFIAVAAALLVTCFGGTYYLVNHYGKPLFEETKVVVKEATEFAATTDNAGCVAESNIRFKDGNPISLAMKATAFLSTCLSGSKPTPGFCDDVPEPRDMVKSQPWQRERCGKIDGKDMQCPMSAAVVQNFCHPHDKG